MAGSKKVLPSSVESNNKQSSTDVGTAQDVLDDEGNNHIIEKYNIYNFIIIITFYNYY